jgi:hypothetical protein
MNSASARKTAARIAALEGSSWIESTAMSRRWSRSRTFAAYAAWSCSAKGTNRMRRARPARCSRSTLSA